MIFVGIVLVAIFLYIRNYKVSALFLFFFFITSGFNLIPEEITKFVFISKGTDYAFLILLGVIAIDSLFIKDYFSRDTFFKYLIAFGSFLFICVLYNKFALKLGWGDILRTCRYHFFWIAYFTFRNMEKESLEKLMKYLFFVTLFTSSLYLLQIVIGKNILVETAFGYVRLFGVKIPRFYNQPDMLFFFTFFAIYNNPLKGISKKLSTIILITALLGAFHRNLLGGFVLSILIGYVITLPRLQRIRFFAIASSLLLFVIVFAGYMFVYSRTYEDIQTVVSGNITEVDIDINDIDSNSTFTFRMLHFLERNQYLLEHPKAMFLGAGLLPEDSKLVEKMFDFKIGLVEELTDNIIQLDTGDISYSILFLRLGYLGTLLNLSLFIYFMVFFYKNRGNKYGFSSFLYFILTWIASFFSANLLNPVTFILPLISYHIIKKTNIEEIKAEK